MKTFHAFPLNPIDALANQVIIAGADGIAVASALKTINNQSLLGSGNIEISVDLTGYATTAYVDDQVSANGASLQAFASNASNLSSGTVPDVRLSANIPRMVGGLIQAINLPSYVDDVIEAANLAAFPGTGETGKIYVALDTGKTYRWSGSAYVELTDATAVWGQVSGTLANQTDLQAALNAKVNIADFAEAVDDEVATLLQAGTDVTVTYNDAANTLTVGLGSNVPRLNAANTFTILQTVQAASSSTKALIAKAGGASATVPIFEVQDSAGNAYAHIWQFTSNAQIGVLGPSGAVGIGFTQSTTARPNIGLSPGDANTCYFSNGTNIGGFRLRSDTTMGGLISYAGLHLTQSGGSATLYGSIWVTSGNVFQFRNYGTTTPSAIDCGAITASGNITASGSIRPGQFTVATLPSAAANTGRTVQVTDSSVDFPGNIGNTVAAGGAFNVDVKSNGTNWRITG